MAYAVFESTAMIASFLGHTRLSRTRRDTHCRTVFLKRALCYNWLSGRAGGSLGVAQLASPLGRRHTDQYTMVLARDTPPADRSIPVLHCRGADRRQARQCFGVSAGPWLSRPLVYWPSASRGSPAHLLPPPAAQGSH